MGISLIFNCISCYIFSHYLGFWILNFVFFKHISFASSKYYNILKISEIGRLMHYDMWGYLWERQIQWSCIHISKIQYGLWLNKMIMKYDMEPILILKVECKNYLFFILFSFSIYFVNFSKIELIQFQKFSEIYLWRSKNIFFKKERVLLNLHWLYRFRWWGTRFKV